MVSTHHYTPPTQLMTSTKIAQLETNRRSTALKNAELTAYVNTSNLLTHSANNEARVVNARRSNAVERVRNENDMREQLERKEYDDKMNGLLYTQNAQLATNISIRNSKNERMEREIQRMCDTSDELKELEKKLNIAYVNKERAAQHQEGLYMKQLEMSRENAIDNQMEYERQKAIKFELDKDDVRRDGMLLQKSVLQQQILDRKSLAVEAREEAARDKVMVEDIVNKINEQDRLEVHERNEKKEETRQLVKYFQVERERKKSMIMQEEHEQEMEIKAYYEKLARRMQEEEVNKKRAEEEKKRRWAKVVEETRSQNASKDEFNVLRDMLWEEELEAKRISDDKLRVIKREEDKKNMMLENQKQLKNKKAMIAQMEVEEDRLVEVMLTKFKVDEQVEADKQERRLDMKNEYIKNIKGQREQRAQLYEHEKEKELAERDYAGEMEEYRLRVISEARKRLLLQHASKLKGFLPKGAMVNEEEYNIVNNAREGSGNGGGYNGGRVRMNDGYISNEEYENLR